MDVTFTSHRVLWDRFYNFHLETGGFPGGTMVKNPPTKQDPWAWSLGGDDPLEKEMATHFNICVWEIPWTEESGGLQSMGSKKSQNNWATKPPANLGWFDVKIRAIENNFVKNEHKYFCFKSWHKKIIKVDMSLEKCFRNTEMKIHVQISLFLTF